MELSNKPADTYTMWWDFHAYLLKDLPELNRFVLTNEYKVKQMVISAMDYEDEQYLKIQREIVKLVDEWNEHQLEERLRSVREEHNVIRKKLDEGFFDR